MSTAAPAAPRLPRTFHAGESAPVGPSAAAQAQVAADAARRAFALGQWSEAIPSLETALRRAPADLGLRALLAQAQGAAGQVDQAARTAKIVATQGGQVGAVIALVRAQLAAGHRREARRTLDILPRGVRARADLLALRGQIALADRRLGEAELTFREALAQAPREPSATAGLTAVRLARGDVLSAAKIVGKEGGGLPVELARASVLVAMGRPAPAATILRGLLDSTLVVADRARVLGLLGECEDAQGQEAAALDTWTAMNRLIGHRFDAAAWADKIDRLERWFHSPTAHALPRTVRVDRPGPIFVVGAPGAGIGLVESLFAHHPAVESMGDWEELNRLVERLPAQLGTAVPECLGDLVHVAAASLSRGYLQAVGPRPEASPWWIDGGVQNLLHLGVIDMLFPDARIVCVERDPADLALQMFRRPWMGAGAAHTGSMADIEAWLHGHDRLLSLWRRVLRRPIHSVRLEDLVANPGSTARRLVQSVGLPWHPGVLEPLVRRGSPRSIGAARRYQDHARNLAA